MTTKNETRATALFGGALAAALQWRLLVVWTLGVLLPTLLLWIPTWRMTGGLLDFSPAAAGAAHHFDMIVMSDLGVALGKGGGALAGASLSAVLVMLLVSPFLAGVTAAAARHPAGEAPLGFVALVQGGDAWYGRMFRLALVSLVPLGVAGAIASVAFKVAGKSAELAIYESQANRASHVATLIAVVVFVLLHATVEAGRAQLIADPRLRSAWRAWARGVKATVRRPLGVLGLYVGVTLVSLVVAMVLLMLRIRVVPAELGAFWVAFILTQLGAAAIGWGRAARLFALAALFTPAVAAEAPLAPSPTPSPTGA